MKEPLVSDRPMKMLLALAVIALWGLLLRPLFTPTPVQAQSAAASSTSACLQVTENGKIYVTTDRELIVYQLDKTNKIKVLDARPLTSAP